MTTPYHIICSCPNTDASFHDPSLILQVAAIGPTTAEALANAGIQVDATASKPNAESLVQTVASPVPT